MGGTRSQRSARSVVAIVAVWALLVACGGDGGDGGGGVDPRATATASLAVTSEAFDDGGTIPARFTCEGEESVPSLSWSDLPAGTEQVAVTVTDPDAPGGTFVHWLAVFPPDPGAPTVEGRNGFGDTGYGGPCPPEGDEPHRYVFTAYASGSALDLESGFSAADLETALEDDLLAQGRLTATYGR